jgi:hypothetical protein
VVRQREPELDRLAIPRRTGFSQSDGFTVEQHRQAGGLRAAPTATSKAPDDAIPPGADDFAKP